MKKLIIIIVKAMAVIFAATEGCALAQSYTVERSGRVVDQASCYSFQIPKGWKAVPGNPIPLLFNFAPGPQANQLQTLPLGAASIALHPEPALGREESLSANLMRSWAYAHSLSSSKELRISPKTGITRAVEVQWIDDELATDGDPPTQTTAVSFIHRGQLFAVYLTFYVNDGRRGQYLAALTQVLESFVSPELLARSSVRCSSNK